MCWFHVMSNVKDNIEVKNPTNKEHIVTNVDLRNQIIADIKNLHGCSTQIDYQTKN